MKPIKFDLPLNGTRIATLEQLEENLTPEILVPFRSGKLVKWLRVRMLNEQADAVEALLAADNKDEVQLFKGLMELFGGETNEGLLRTAIVEYKQSLFKGLMELFNGETNEGLLRTAIVEYKQSLYSSQNANDAKIEQKDSEKGSDCTTAEASVSKSETESPLIRKKYSINKELLYKVGMEERFFVTDRIPKYKLENALKSYAKNLDEDEEPLMLYDDTVWGSAKDGFLLTNRWFYCKIFLKEKKTINLDKIYKVKVNQYLNRRLEINGQNFYEPTGISTYAIKIFVTFLKDYLALSDDGWMPESSHTDVKE